MHVVAVLFCCCFGIGSWSVQRGIRVDESAFIIIVKLVSDTIKKVNLINEYETGFRFDETCLNSFSLVK